jgi:methyl-accepting chemotaxis protein
MIQENAGIHHPVSSTPEADLRAVRGRILSHAMALASRGSELYARAYAIEALSNDLKANAYHLRHEAEQMAAEMQRMASDIDRLRNALMVVYACTEGT